MSNFGCIILAAGKGERFGRQKQFISFGDKHLWEKVRDEAKKVTNDIVVVGIDTPPGDTRQHSVRIGLGSLDNDRVVIAEAARPLVTSDMIKKIADVQFPSVSYAIRSVDTVFDLSTGMHLDRKESYLLQVPQAFDRKKLIQAHDRTRVIKDATDDTILMKLCFGITPKLIPGSGKLHKITFPYDVEILKVLNNA